MKERKKIIIVLIIIGIVLIFSAIRSAYYTYKTDKTYEEKGYQTATATCMQENSYVKGKEGMKYYQRTYLYSVYGKEYTLNTVEHDSKPYKTIKYNPINPNEAETYKVSKITNMVVLFFGLICVCSPYIIKNINIKKIEEIKQKILRMSKRNITKNVTICFYGYLGISIILVLKQILQTPNKNLIMVQSSPVVIIAYIIGRNTFNKFASYFNIFRF